MDKIILRDNDEAEIDFALSLHEFQHLNYELIESAYIDGRSIDTRGFDRDNIDRRWFAIMHSNGGYRVDADGWRDYSGDEIVYVRLFDESMWQRYINDRNALLVKYGAKVE